MAVTSLVGSVRASAVATIRRGAPDRHGSLSRHGFLNRHGATSAWLAVKGLLAIALLTGCDAREPIATYSVPKDWVRDELRPPAGPQSAEQPAPIDGRILGAILPHGQRFWFFKLSGPDAAVAAKAAAVRQFLATVELADGDDAEPRWSLPEGWKQMAGNAARFATLAIPGEESPLELAVSALPLPPEAAAEGFLLSNVNRWRNQVQLPPVTGDELPQQSEQLVIAGRPATLVDVAGKLSAGGMGRLPGLGRPPGLGAGGPSSGGAAPKTDPSTTGPDGSAPPRNSVAGSAAAQSPGAQLRFQTPDGWRETANDGFSAKAFEVGGADGATARVTVSPLAGTGGDLLANVNRWRGQAGLAPIAQDALSSATKPITVDQQTGQFIEIVGEGGASARAIYGVVLPRGETTWFIKMTGPAELVVSQRTRFEEFAQSLRFEP